ncbi:Deoxyribodipyrimidine photo-lyase [Candidatus Zixiibacteriota bacterium]|nr:Deoxyribodipyrimidine photo-lyase [candidate division Zixibacteria bacterium]
MIEKDRIRPLNAKKIINRKYVIYWMQASPRASYNHALEYAVSEANKSDKPLIVFFGITDHFPSANLRHYTFMLEGLQEVKDSLEERGIKLVVRYNSPEFEIAELAREGGLIVVDRGYTRIQRYWRRCVAGLIDCPIIQVESDAIVPVETVSLKEEYTAASIRPKIQRFLRDYLRPLRPIKLKRESLRYRLETFDISNLDRALKRLQIDHSVAPIADLKGGLSHAETLLDEFIVNKLKYYDSLRNDPSRDFVSHLSPYLHFGQISPIQVALEVMTKRGTGPDAFLEELIIRRELSLNFVNYNVDYDRFEGLPEWCRATLKKHESDKREYLYTLAQLEKGETHDSYWNAAQKEMVGTGKMAGYMRMYWGKKIIEWVERPEEAYRYALYLNDKYELDGRDPNGYAGVAWCFGKHDRPWSERPVFGNIRYMNADGLKRKFDIEKYVRQVNDRCRAAEAR